MTHKNAFEARDKTLRDISSTISVMGGVTPVMARHFSLFLVVPEVNK